MIRSRSTAPGPFGGVRMEEAMQQARQARIVVVGSGPIGDLLVTSGRAAGHDVVYADYPTSQACDMDWLILTAGFMATIEAAPWRAGTPTPALSDEMPCAEVVHAVLDPRPEYQDPRIVVPDSSQAALEFAELIGETALALPEWQMVATQWRAALREIATLPIAALARRGLDVFSEHDPQSLAVAVLGEVIEIAQAEGVRIDNAEAHAIVASAADNARNSPAHELVIDLGYFRELAAPILDRADLHACPAVRLRTLATLVQAMP